MAELAVRSLGMASQAKLMLLDQQNIMQTLQPFAIL